MIAHTQSYNVSEHAHNTLTLRYKVKVDNRDHHS